MKTGIKISGRQMVAETVSDEQIKDGTVGQRELADDSITPSKLTLKSVQVRHLADEVIGRLLPEASDDRDYIAALGASNSPSLRNPFATRADLESRVSAWRGPFEETASFSSDDPYVVRINRQTLVPWVKQPSLGAVPLPTDHSRAVNLESLDDHRHLTIGELEAVRRMGEAGFDPAEPSGPPAAGSLQYTSLIHASNLQSGYGIQINHPPDPQGHRAVRIFTTPASMSALYSASYHLGHGFWPTARNIVQMGFGGYWGQSLPTREVDGLTVDVPQANCALLDSGACGMHLATVPDAVVTQVERKQAGLTTVSLSRSVNQEPYVLSDLVVDESGWIGPHVKHGWGPSRLLDTMDLADSRQLMADGQGGLWVLGINSDGRLTCGLLVGDSLCRVALASQGLTSPWSQDKVTVCAAAIGIAVLETTAIDRRMYVALVSDDGAQYVLVSDSLPATFGDDGRLLAEQGSYTLSFSYYRLPSGWWTSHADFLPTKMQILVIANGQASAARVLLACDGQSLLWAMMPQDDAVSMSGAERGEFGNEGVACDFRAAAAPVTIEAIVRGAEATPGWRHERMALDSGSLVKLGAACNGDGWVLPYTGENRADICVLTRAYAEAGSWFTSRDEAVVLYAAFNDPQGPSITLRAQWLFEDATPTYRCIGLEQDWQLDLRAGARIRMMGGCCGLLAISSAEAGGNTRSWEIRIPHTANRYTEDDMPFLAPGPEFDGSLLTTATCPVRAVERVFEQDPATIDRTRHGDIVVLPNDHDVGGLVVAESGECVVWRREHAVRMRCRQNALWDQEAVGVDHDGLLPYAEGSRLLSMRCADETYPADWLFFTGGTPDSDGIPSSIAGVYGLRQAVGSTEVEFIRTVAGGSLFAEAIGRRSHHAAYSIFNLEAYAVNPPIAANSALLFFFGGLANGTIDSHTHGSLATPCLVRLSLTNLTSDTELLAENLLPTAAVGGDMSAVVPASANCYMCLMMMPGATWAMAIVSPPNVWLIEELEDRSFFGDVLPDARDARNITADSSVQLSARSALAGFQQVYGQGDEVICWNPDLQLSQPGKTIVLSYGGQSVDSPERSLRVVVLNPAAIDDCVWDMVSVSGGRLPEPRMDATLVYSGLWYQDQPDEPMRHLFYMYGGQSSAGTLHDDLWLLEYWSATVSGGGLAHYGRWTYLSSSRHFGLLPQAKCAGGIMTPEPVARDERSGHGAWFFGGRVASGAAIGDLHRIHLPARMADMPNIDLEVAAYDHGGPVLPVGSYVISDPIDISQVMRITNLALHGFWDDGIEEECNALTMPREADDIYIGLAVDSPLNLHSLYDDGGGTGVWTDIIPYGDLLGYRCLCRLSEFAIMLPGTPLVRGIQSWFPAVGVGGRTLYMVLYFDNRQQTRPSMLRSALLSTMLANTTLEEHCTWQEARDPLLKPIFVSPHQTIVLNATGSTIDAPIKVVVQVPR